MMLSLIKIIIIIIFIWIVCQFKMIIIIIHWYFLLKAI